MSKPSWTERLFGGFKKTSERLSENLTEVVSKAKLDDATGLGDPVARDPFCLECYQGFLSQRLQPRLEPARDLE